MLYFFKLDNLLLFGCEGGTGVSVSEFTIISLGKFSLFEGRAIAPKVFLFPVIGIADGCVGNGAGFVTIVVPLLCLFLEVLLSLFFTFF